MVHSRPEERQRTTVLGQKPQLHDLEDPWRRETRTVLTAICGRRGVSESWSCARDDGRVRGALAAGSAGEGIHRTDGTRNVQ